MARSKGSTFDPGGGTSRGDSYAERLRTNVNYDQRLKRNVLEIVLEKTEKDAEIVLDQDCVAKIIRSIGMDLVSQVEGYQVQHNGRTSLISVWVAKGVSLEKFCRVEGINVSKGVVTGTIRPAGRTDVTVAVIGTDFNTPDSLVFEYITKFGGTVVNQEVIYCKYTEGPFKGKYNGERRYQVDFSNSTRKMGTYHFLDGARVRIFYRGNDKTCGRCHQTSKGCPGGGIAKNCEEAGGERIFLQDHMKRVWSEIGFVPSSFKLPEILESDIDQPISSNLIFPRQENTANQTAADIERIVGLTIANISLEVEDEAIKKFVIENVSEEIEDGNINIIRDQRKAVATVTHSLTSATVQAALLKINFNDCKTKFFGKPLYCRSIRDITPEKQDLVESSGSE